MDTGAWCISRAGAWAFVVFVGDFQQLQPVEGDPLLKTALDRQVITQMYTYRVCFRSSFSKQNRKQKEVDNHCNSHPHAGTGRLRKIVLQQHPAARCTDQVMLNFLEWIRFHQPSRDLLTNFFHGRHMSRDLDRCVAQSIALENERNRTFTFLTVTNAGASDLNWARVRKDFPNIHDKLDIAGCAC